MTSADASASLSRFPCQARPDLAGLSVVSQLLIQAQRLGQQIDRLAAIARALAGPGEAPESDRLTVPVRDATPDRQRLAVTANGILLLAQAQVGITEVAE